MKTKQVLSGLGVVIVIVAVLVVGLLPRLGFLGIGDEPDGIESRARGAAEIGGPFTLVNGAGETVTEASFPGQYVLIYFGYTYCPDVCPTSLQAMTDALNQLEPAVLDKVQPVFVSVDPERDTPVDVAEYASFFHPKLIGLTGSPEQVAAAAKAYRVYYARVDQPHSAAGYLLDHSAITYLTAPDGSLAAFFKHGTDPNEMADRLRGIVGGAGT